MPVVLQVSNFGLLESASHIYPQPCPFARTQQAKYSKAKGGGGGGRGEDGREGWVESGGSTKDEET